MGQTTSTEQALDIFSLPPEIRESVLLQLSQRDLLAYCEATEDPLCTGQDFHILRVVRKTQEEFDITPEEFWQPNEIEGLLWRPEEGVKRLESARQRRIQIISRSGATEGSEVYLTIRECVFRSILLYANSILRLRELLKYFGRNRSPRFELGHEGNMWVIDAANTALDRLDDYEAAERECHVLTKFYYSRESRFYYSRDDRREPLDSERVLQLYEGGESVPKILEMTPNSSGNILQASLRGNIREMYEAIRATHPYLAAFPPLPGSQRSSLTIAQVQSSLGYVEESLLHKGMTKTLMSLSDGIHNGYPNRATFIYLMRSGLLLNETIFTNPEDINLDLLYLNQIVHFHLRRTSALERI